MQRKENLATTGLNIISGSIVEIGQREHGDAHEASGRRLHGFAHDLGGVGDGDQIEIFAQGADQDRLPEKIDGIFGLAVPAAPVEKGFASVARSGEGERGDGSRDGEFVVGVEKGKARNDGAV